MGLQVSFVLTASHSAAKLVKIAGSKIVVREALRKKYVIIWEFFPTWGEGLPKTLVN